MLVKGTYQGNTIFTDDGVFEVKANTGKAFAGVFEINNIRCEETEKTVNVEGRFIKVFIPKLKADIAASYKQLEETPSFDAYDAEPVTNELELDSEDDDEFISEEEPQSAIELCSEEQEETVKFYDSIAKGLDKEIRYFDKPLNQLQSFKIDSTQSRDLIQEQSNMLLRAGFKFQASTQTYIKD